jgi:glycosyltransferase involved in cell wall biosynthesis
LKRLPFRLDTVLEVMSCGLPVASFEDCAGVRILVRYGENGLLVQERRVDALQRFACKSLP